MSPRTAGNRNVRPTLRAGGPPDVVTFLTVYFVLLYAIPSNRVIASMGSAGSVSLVWAGGAAILWFLYYIQRTGPSLPQHSHPVRTAAFVFLTAALLSYTVAMTRALPAEEVNTADTGLIRLVAWAGIMLMTIDGIGTFDRFLVLLRRLVAAGGILAGLGILQFVTRMSFIDLVTIPGLATGDGYALIETRGGLVRAAGTANHPLEYGLVLVMILPFALTLALHEKSRSALVRWLPVPAIVLALFLSGSRSALVGLLVAVVVLIPTWSAAVRWRIALAAVTLVAVVYVVSPRVITNLRYLFVAISDDPSVSSRTDSIGIVGRVFGLNPVFGRGYGTFLPQYRILDNEYLLLLLEVGVVGLAAFIALAGVAASSALLAGRRSRIPVIHDIGYALAGSVFAGGALLALFDGLSFPQAAGTLFVVFGLCGAYWRLHRHYGDYAAPGMLVVARDGGWT
jgi:polysaccharide biosynthesis protein PslJ